jgi:hypothetical protein
LERTGAETKGRLEPNGKLGLRGLTWRALGSAGLEMMTVTEEEISCAMSAGENPVVVL